MTYRKLTIATIAVAVCILAGSSAMAHGHGGFGGGGFSGGGGFGRAGFNSGGFRGGFNGRGFNGGSFRGGDFRARGFRSDRFHHRDFDNRFVFCGDFGDPFFYYPYSYYGYYPYGYYPYDYGYGSYDSYNEPVYPSRAVYTGSLVRQVQLRLARAGYYHGSIDGVSGNATRRAIREYESAHGLPGDGRIGQRLLATMGVS